MVGIFLFEDQAYRFKNEKKERIKLEKKKLFWTAQEEEKGHLKRIQQVSKHTLLHEILERLGLYFAG